jgi:hypothetical protein
VWSSGGVIQRKYTFFNPVACCFLYKAKDSSAPLVFKTRPFSYLTTSEKIYSMNIQVIIIFDLPRVVYLFPLLNQRLRGHIFLNDDGTEASLKVWLEKQETDFYRHGTEKPIPRYQCLSLHGYCARRTS